MRIVIVGAVAGGMSAAARARRLAEDAEIIVLDRGDYASFANCGLPYYLSGEITEVESLLVQTPESLAASLNLDVRLRHDVTGLDPLTRTLTVAITTETDAGSEVSTQTLSYDQLILSPGARAARPPIPGLDHSLVRPLRTINDVEYLASLLDGGGDAAAGSRVTSASATAVETGPAVNPASTAVSTSATSPALASANNSKTRQAVVLGSGFIGLEAAEALAMRGLEVTLVELADQVMPSLEPELAALLHHELEDLGIRVLTGVAAQRVLPGAEEDQSRPGELGNGKLAPAELAPAELVTVELSSGEQLSAHLVVLATGITPDTEVFAAAGLETDRGYFVTDEFGRTNLPSIWAVGDAVLSTDLITGARRPIALAGPANRAGRIVAENIVRPNSPRRLPELLGTAIVRVGSLSAASTGANRAALSAAKIPFTTVHLHPNHHAGYFPSALPIHMVAHFHQESGKLLGAAAVGQKGVDKRIDVLATALKTGLDAQGLIDLDLSYSPPFGQAKDPVNLLGMVAEGVVSGNLNLWQPAEIAQVAGAGVFIDTRSPAEFARDRIKGAVNIPHTQLRGRLAEVRELVSAQGSKSRALLICESGMRSHLAHRVLAQHAMASASLSGGMMSLRPALRAAGTLHNWIEEN